MSLKIVQNRVSRVSQSISSQQCNIVLGRSSGFHARDFFLEKLTPDLILGIKMLSKTRLHLNSSTGGVKTYDLGVGNYG